jgi:hypothetical protein
MILVGFNLGLLMVAVIFCLRDENLKTLIIIVGKSSALALD